MNKSVESALNFAVSLRDLPDAAAVVASLAAFGQQFGWGTVAIGTMPQSNNGHLPPFFYANWPGWFQEAYVAERLVEVDPIVKFASTARNAANWAEIAAAGGSENGGGRMFDVTKDYGWRNGLAVPILGRGGYRAIGSFAGVAPDNSPTEQHLLHLAVILAHDQLRDLHANGAPASLPQLTPREREVLKWLVAGKTNWEISEILVISERTVHFHVNRLRQKLAAANRAQIAAIAISRGLVAL